MEAELAALATSGATTLVGLMVSDSWGQAKARVTRFFARQGGGGEAAADEELEGARDELSAARNDHGTGTTLDVQGALRRRLLRMLEEDPASAGELLQLLRELTGAARTGSDERYGTSRNVQAHHGITYDVQPLPRREVKPYEVPALTVEFINRTADLAAVDGAFGPGGGDDDRVGLLVLGGTPGVGKSALASRWSHRSRSRFPDGQLYVDFAGLRGHAGGDVSAAVGMCLRSLGVRDEYMPETLMDRIRLYRTRSAEQRFLLVLDDVSEPAQVRALVPQGPGSAVLVTSTNGLGELAFDGARLLSVEPLDAEGGLALLADRCGEAAVAAEQSAAERLVELCGGLPVALHVVAARLQSSRRLTMARLCDELADENKRLTAMSLGGESPMSAVFDSAYRQLPPEAARFYRLLGCLPCRTFDTGLAATATGLDTATAESLLDRLVDEAGLLELTPDHRYRFHSLVRLHARERAAHGESVDERRGVTERVATHYLALTAFADRALQRDRLRIAKLDEPLRAAVNPFGGEGGLQPLAWLEAERANIVDTLRAAAEQQLHAPVWQLSEAFTVLFFRHRHLGDWKESLELGAAAAAGDLEPAAEARLRSLLSRPLMDLGENDRARAELETALACAEVADDPGLQGSVLEFHGRYWDRFDPARAVTVYERSVELNEEARLPRGVAIALFFLGRAQDATGDPALALTTLRRAREELLAVPDTRMAARATAAIGRALDHLGDTGAAVTELREAARVLREEEATHYEAEALLDLVAVAERTGGDRAALRADLARALRIHEDGGSPRAAELSERLRRLDDDAA